MKGTDTFGTGNNQETHTNWETYKISKNATTDEWELDWSTNTWSASIGKKESTFGQDMDGDEVIWSLNNISVTAVTDSDGNATDTATTGSTGVQLTKDAKGALYITKGENNIAIVDSDDVAVNFDWQDNWGGQSHTAKSWAVEGIDSNSDGSIDKYKLAIKHTFVDKRTEETDIQWETFEIATTGVVDWNSGTWGDIKIHESDLN